MCRGLLVSLLTTCVGSNGEIRKATNLLVSPKHCLSIVLGHLLSGSLHLPEIELAAWSDRAVHRKKQNLHVKKKVIGGSLITFCKRFFCYLGEKAKAGLLLLWLHVPGARAVVSYGRRHPVVLVFAGGWLYLLEAAGCLFLVTAHTG